jgi:hypothetical protein
VLLFRTFLRDEALVRANGDVHQYASTSYALLAGHGGDTSGYYPPLANIVFITAYLNPLPMPFHRSMILLMMIWAGLGTLFTALYLRVSDLKWVMFAIPLSIALLEPSVFFARFDFFPMLLILLACLSQRRQKEGYAGALLAGATLLKFSPVFLFPLFHVLTPLERRRHFWLSAGAAGGAILLLHVLLAGPEQTIQSVAGFVGLRAGHPVYSLATASSIDLFIRKLLGGNGTIEWIGPNIGHFNTGLPVWMPSFLLLLCGGGSLVIAWMAARNPARGENILLYASAVLLWVLFATPLLTMHYYLWVLPVIFLWWLETADTMPRVERRHVIIGVLASAVALLGQYFYPHAYFDLVDRQTDITVTLNLIRNLLVLWLMAEVLKVANRAH